MRIAIISDIHANLEALNAVILDAETHGATQFVCLGDIVGYNADPSACLQRIKALDCPVIKGNHDEVASNEDSLHSMNPLAAFALQWTRDHLSDEEKTWLRRLRMIRQVSDFSIVHSSLDQPNDWNYVTNRFDAMSSFSFQFTSLCFHGHTHVPKVYCKADNVKEIPPGLIELDPNKKYFVNVGSVGQPRDGDPRACYVIYDLSRGVLIFRRVVYDIALAQQKIIERGLPEELALRLNEGS